MAGVGHWGRAVTDAAIELSEVVKAFGNRIAVGGISLRIEEGDFAAFIGPSGCGKTTTLRLIAGLERPSEGDILCRGRRINDDKPWQRNLPLVWQNFALFPFLTVQQNVEFGLRMKGVDKATRLKSVRRWLERVGIAEFAGRSITELSGGQKQRVALARSLVTEPSILLLDEPLGSLDAHLRILMQSELKALQRELGITFIYVTHNQSEAFAMANKVVIMKDGKVEQIGSPQEVYRSPQSRFVAEFVGTNNLLSGKVVDVARDRVKISTGVGDFVAPIGLRKCVLGDPTTIVVSADVVSLSADEAASENCVVGKIMGEEFIGSVITLFLELSDGSVFRVQKQQHEVARLQAQFGRKLNVHWGPESTYLLPH
jgi:spermidine/putrescine transport system ATP-binding protein